MKAIVLNAPHDFSLQEIDDPAVSAEDLEIRVNMVGICGKDLSMAASGLLGITIPGQWGGVGADTQSYALVMEEMSVGYTESNDVQRFLIADQVFSEVK